VVLFGFAGTANFVELFTLTDLKIIINVINLHQPAKRSRAVAFSPYLQQYNKVILRRVTL